MLAGDDDLGAPIGHTNALMDRVPGLNDPLPARDDDPAAPIGRTNALDDDARALNDRFRTANDRLLACDDDPTMGVDEVFVPYDERTAPIRQGDGLTEQQVASNAISFGRREDARAG